MILFIKMLKDLRQNLTQFMATFIMSFFALFVISGLGVLNNNNIDRYLKETNFKDLDIQGVGFTQNSINTLLSLDGIVSVDGWYNTTGTTELDKKYKLVLSFISDNTVSKMHIVEGEEYTQGSEGIWIEERFADSKDIKVGDYITIDSENNRIKERVMGLVNSPSYIDYIGDPAIEEEDYTQYGFGIMDISRCVNKNPSFDTLFVDVKGVDNQVYLTENEDKILDEISLKISNLFDCKNVIITPKNKDSQVVSYTERVTAYDSLKIIFAVVFGIIAMVGILSTMTRLIAKQRITIGTLKALGFGSRTIMMHYLSYTIVVVIVGCISGAIAGYYVVGDVVYHGLADYYINPYEGKQVSSAIYIGTFLLLILTIVVSYLSNKKILKLSASRILQPEAPKSSKESWYERTVLWKKIKFATQWNIRDVSKNAMRSIISILGVIACCALLFMAGGFLQVMMNLPYWYYGDLITAKNRIAFSDSADYFEVYDYAKEYEGQMVSEEAIDIISDSGNVNCYMSVADAGNCYYFQDSKGNYMDLPKDGVAISSKAAALSGLQLGDLVTWKIKGTDKSYCERISAIYKAPMIQGVSISREYYEKMNGSFQPTYVYTNKTIPKGLADDKAEIISAIACSQIRGDIESVSSESYSVVGIIIFVAFLLGTVIMYNMGIMAYTEKAKDMATLKVLGFCSRDLKEIILQQNIWIAFIGMILGMPFGYRGIMLLTVIWGEKTDDFIIKLTAFPYLLSIIGVFGIAIIVNIMIVKKIDTINMVEALKEV